MVKFSLGISRAIALLTLLTLSMLPGAARANDRHFAFTHESPTLAAGTWEIEPWVTVHGGRRQAYAGVDYRVEFEGGLTDRLQAALYFNGAYSTDGADGAVNSASLEFKYRIFDPVADALGLALYVEATAGPTLAELEAQVIVDKRIGRWIFAGNVVGEYDWFVLPYETRELLEVHANLAAGYRLTDALCAGLEVWSYNRFSTTPEVLTEVASAYLGPSVSYRAEHAWVALSVLPQVGALRMASPHEFRNLDTADGVYARLVAGLSW